MRYPTANTKLIILLGNPLGHSYSSYMHNQVFGKRKMDYLYLPVEVDKEDLVPVFSALTKMNTAGFNITIPYKIKIMPLLDEIDPQAKMIGAVNTICVTHGRIKGYNTDGAGFLQSIENRFKLSIAKKNMFIMGCGGTARAIAMTLAAHGVEKLFICNRTIDKAHALAADINQKIRTCVEVISKGSDDMAKALQESKVLINCTSLGMYPQIDKLPLDPNLLRNDLAVVDIVYNPPMTALLKAAQKIGCPIANGLGMLVYQGISAFELWTGTAPSADEMFAAVKKMV